MRLVVVAPLLIFLTMTSGACGSGVVGDCSDGTFDGHGGCIPNSHAPRRVEAAAIHHFHGEQVDRVGCYVQREFRRRGARVTVWGCWRVAGGVLTHDLACIPETSGSPLTPLQRAAIPARRLRCSPP